MIAVLGQELSSGKFEVEEYTYCGIPPQTSTSVDSCLVQGEDRLNDVLLCWLCMSDTTPCLRYVLMVSGLGIGSTSRDPLTLQLLVDTVIGHLGGPQVGHEIYVTAGLPCDDRKCLGPGLVFKDSTSYCGRKCLM